MSRGIPRLIFVYFSLRSGGGNRVFFELTKRLLDGKRAIKTLFPIGARPLNLPFGLPEGTHLTPIGLSSRSPLVFLVNLVILRLYCMSLKKTDLIIVSDPLLSLLFFPIRNEKILRFVQADDYHLYDDLRHFRFAWIMRIYHVLCRLSFHYPVNFLFNSQFVYNRYIEVCQRKEVPFLKVNPCVTLSVFYSIPHSRRSKIRVGTIGRKQPWKGFEDYLNLVSHFGDNSDFEFVVISNELTAEECVLQVWRPNSDSELADMYRSCDVFISTSWRVEGFGLPQLEAMSCGCAVIATDSGGIDEYAIDGQNCLVVPPRDVLAMARALISLGENGDLLRKLQEGGVETGRRFEWQVAVQRFVAVVEGISEESFDISFNT